MKKASSLTFSFAVLTFGTAIANAETAAAPAIAFRISFAVKCRGR